MSQKTAIQWTDATWNPVVGCTRISAGCKNCYAHQLHDMRHKAFHAGKKLPAQYADPFTTVQTMPARLRAPYKWRKPRRIFVNSVSDLFHEDVPFEFINDVWTTMAAAHWHTFQVLTKRPRRMLGFFEWCKEGMRERGLERWEEGVYPMANIHLGVSVENQAAADERIPLLLQVPAAVRFLSCEPLLGPISFRWAKWVPIPSRPDGSSNHLDGLRGIGWVIAGGESGAGARPMDPAWARSLRDQCLAAGVPFFFKQWGAWRPAEFADDWIRECEPENVHHHAEKEPPLIRVSKADAGRLLDGREWNEYPNGPA